MLALIGIGLDTKDISIKALDFLKNADIILYDGYTSIINPGATEFIAEYTGKNITPVKRSDLEEKVAATIKGAASKDMVILVIGDPLVATTHHIILQEARKNGIKTKIFHSSSVFSAAIGESGLDIYKFGPTATIPFWAKNYKPTSFVDVISKNITNGQHTLVLLDIEQKTGRPMSLKEAYDTLISSIGPDAKLGKDTSVIVLGDLGRDTQTSAYTKISRLADADARFKGKTICIIVPGKTSFAEDEEVSALEVF